MERNEETARPAPEPDVNPGPKVTTEGTAAVEADQLPDLGPDFEDLSKKEEKKEEEEIHERREEVKEEIKEETRPEEKEKDGEEKKEKDGKKKYDTRYTQNRELSWLRFDERVLEEARDEKTPLLERLTFASIFTKNLTEFFMIRVGSLHDMTLIREAPKDNKTGMTPQEQLKKIYADVKSLYKQRDKVMGELEARCRAVNICRLSYEELDSKEKKKVKSWYKNEIQPILSPQVVDSHHPFPHLANDCLYIVVNLAQEEREMLGILPVPTSLPPFYQFKERGVHFIMTEEILLKYVDEVFDQFVITDKTVVSVTRNADLAPEDETYDMDADYVQHMRKVVKKRARLAPVRLEVQGNAATAGGDLVRSLCSRLKLTSEQVFYTRSPIRLNYLSSIGKLLPADSAAALSYPPFTPRTPLDLSESERVTPQVLRHDVLLFFPYESMDPFVRLLAEASTDPAVISIKITIYRMAEQAKIGDYLCAAAENGKEVTVLMELRARFDEQNNIRWAERLGNAGCTILYGSEGIKVHCKVCQITRRERGRIRHITQVGTGNYHEKTAKQYTDLSLITPSQEIGEDVARLFQNLGTGNYRGKYKNLLVSPNGIQDEMLEMIDDEIRKGKDGHIFLKFNSLSDRKLIDKLVEASRAGVEVVMNVRGICCLLPGLKGFTENIRVFSIVGRFLEHSRIYCFGKGEDAKVYIASADFMTRNMERRVEVACPILDPYVHERMMLIISMLEKDNVKARLLTSDGTYKRIKSKGEKFSCQDEFMQRPAPLQTPYRRADKKEGESSFSSLLRRMGLKN